jgi:hypothetical protein
MGRRVQPTLAWARLHREPGALGRSSRHCSLNPQKRARNDAASMSKRNIVVNRDGLMVSGTAVFTRSRGFEHPLVITTNKFKNFQTATMSWVQPSPIAWRRYRGHADKDRA